MERDAWRTKISSALFVAPALLFVSACAKIIGADFDSARLAPSRSTDASSEHPLGPEASTCNPLKPLERPPNFAPATDGVDFTVVVNTIDFGDSAPDGGTPGYFTTGYDLDGLCTRAEGPAPCVPQPWIGGFHEDGPRGQDDAVALLMLNQMTNFRVQAIGSSVVNDGVHAGRNAPIAVIRVRKFGGLGEDDHVEVDWFATAALGRGGDGGTSVATDAAVVPRFDATDHWPVLSSSLVDPSVSNPSDMVSVYRDPNAFVTLNTLVAHLPRVSIPLSDVYFDVTDVTLTGTLRRVSSVWRLDDVVMSGWTPTNSLLGVVPQIAYVLFGISFCTDNLANYPKVKRFLCESADLPTKLGDPPSSVCTVTSAGARMTTSPANLGPVVDPPPKPSPCLPATDPANDTCDIPASEE